MPSTNPAVDQGEREAKEQTVAALPKQEHSAPNPTPEEVERSTRKALAVVIILKGYGCQKVNDWHGDGLAGENVVTCIERKGRAGTVTYQVDPFKDRVVPL